MLVISIEFISIVKNNDAQPLLKTLQGLSNYLMLLEFSK